MNDMTIPKSQDQEFLIFLLSLIQDPLDKEILIEIIDKSIGDVNLDNIISKMNEADDD